MAREKTGLKTGHYKCVAKNGAAFLRRAQDKAASLKELHNERGVRPLRPMKFVEQEALDEVERFFAAQADAFAGANAEEKVGLLRSE